MGEQVHDGRRVTANTVNIKAPKLVPKRKVLYYETLFLYVCLLESIAAYLERNM